MAFSVEKPWVSQIWINNSQFKLQLNKYIYNETSGVHSSMEHRMDWMTNVKSASSIPLNTFIKQYWEKEVLTINFVRQKQNKVFSNV